MEKHDNMKKIINWFKKLFGCGHNTSGKNAKFGWKRDLPDPRDYKFKITSPLLLENLPPSVDLRDKCPNVYDQGQLGSCTANALGGVFQFEQLKQQLAGFMPSRLFIYYNTRSLEGTVNEDAGATLRNTLKTMVDVGVCPEKIWNYNTMCFKKKPNDGCYVEAVGHQVLEYLRVTHSLPEIKLCLSLGNPVAFGVVLYESFMSDEVARTGNVPMPNLQTESAIGGHAIMAVGYEDSKNALIMRNSWGTSWGDRGYFYLPYEYITIPNLAADFWSIKLVEDHVTEQNVTEQVTTIKKPRSRKNKK
jgi:C1A family cysteine protease